MASNNWFSNLLPAIQNVVGKQKLVPGLGNSSPTLGDVGNTIGDLASATGYNARAWANGLTGQPQAQPDAGAARGLNMIQGGMMGGPSDAALPAIDTAPEAAAQGIETAGKAAKVAKQGVQDVVDTAAAQPGGLQAGFIGDSSKAVPSVVKDVGKPGAIHIPVSSSVDTAEKQITAQAAADNIPGTTATQKFANVNKRIGELSDQMKTYNTAHPVAVPEQTLRDNYQAQLKHIIAPEGTTVPDAESQGLITQNQANMLTDNFIRQAQLKAGITPTIDPATSNNMYSIDQITQMKQADNAINKGLLSQRATGGKLTPAEEAKLFGRDALDQTIIQKQPAIKNLSLEQSGVYNAEDELGKQSNIEYNNSQKPQPNIVQRIEGAIKGNPVGYGALTIGTGLLGKDLLPTIGGTIGAGMAMAKPAEDSIAKMLGYTPGAEASQSSQPKTYQKQIPHAGIITQPYSEIKPNTDGTYSLPQSAPTGQDQRAYMTEDDYTNGLNSIGQQHTPGTPGYIQAKALLDAQYAGDKQQAEEKFKGNNIENFMTNATTYNSDGNNLLSTLSTMPNATNFWNGVGKAGSIRAYKDPQFADELQQIAKFNDEYSSAYHSVMGKDPNDDQLLSSANSAGQAVKKYNAMMQFISGTYGKYINPYLALNSSSGTQTQQGTPIGNNHAAALPTIQNNDTSGIFSAPAPMRGADAGLPTIQ